jgi:hypothetical protein
VADLITPDDVTATLGAAYSGRADIAMLITAASRMAERYCDRVFEEGEVDDYLDGTGTDAIRVTRPPVSAIDSIEVEGTALDNTDGLAWTADLERGAIHRGRGRVDPRFACRWPEGRRNVRVRYTGGFAETPEDVRFAVLALVRQLADGAGYSSVLRREQIGDYSYELSALAVDRPEIPGFVQALLDPYRLRPI